MVDSVPMGLIIVFAMLMDELKRRLTGDSRR
jgi:hypothetical protein